MNEQQRDEFYIGYLPRAPRKTAGDVFRLCIFLSAILAVAAVLLIAGQNKFPLSVFEFQQYRQFEGVVNEKPYPSLFVQRPAETGILPAASSYLLVAPGKHGASAHIAGLDGKRVRLQGSLIYRDGATMIEIVPDTLRQIDSVETTKPTIEELGVATLVGEIVDSKCYLGVMNPGNTKPHRECAARCISGGVAPLFIVHTTDGQTLSLLLVSEKGEPVNKDVLDIVAEPVKISGKVIRQGDQLYLRANPANYHRER
jgi:hypothetical protein